MKDPAIFAANLSALLESFQFFNDLEGAHQKLVWELDRMLNLSRSISIYHEISRPLETHIFLSCCGSLEIAALAGLIPKDLSQQKIEALVHAGHLSSRWSAVLQMTRNVWNSVEGSSLNDPDLPFVSFGSTIIDRLNGDLCRVMQDGEEAGAIAMRFFALDQYFAKRFVFQDSIHLWTSDEKVKTLFESLSKLSTASESLANSSRGPGGDEDEIRVLLSELSDFLEFASSLVLLLRDAQPWPVVHEMITLRFRAWWRAIQCADQVDNFLMKFFPLAKTGLEEIGEALDYSNHVQKLLSGKFFDMSSRHGTWLRRSYPVGTSCEATVRGLSNEGVFLDLQGGGYGFLPNKVVEIDGTAVAPLSELYQKGDVLMAQVVGCSSPWVVHMALPLLVGEAVRLPDIFRFYPGNAQVKLMSWSDGMMGLVIAASHFFCIALEPPCSGLLIFAREEAVADALSVGDVAAIYVLPDMQQTGGELFRILSKGQIPDSEEQGMRQNIGRNFRPSLKLPRVTKFLPGTAEGRPFGAITRDARDLEE